MWTFWLIFPLILVLFCLTCSAGNSTLVGSSEPIVGLVGDAAVLPCKVDPPQPIWLTELVEWIRVDPLHHADDEFVYDIQNGNKVVNPDFSDRFHLFRSQLINGNVSLKLYNLKPSDVGTYECHIPTVRTLKEATGCRVDLKLGAVSKPKFNNLGPAKDGGLDLQCEAEGWYPEPKMEWRGVEACDGRRMAPQEVKSSQDGFYTVTRNITIKKPGWITCQVRLPALNLTRQELFQVQSFLFNTRTDYDLWCVGIVVAVVFTVVFAVVFAVSESRKARKRCAKWCPVLFHAAKKPGRIIHVDPEERTRGEDPGGWHSVTIDL